MVEKREMAHSHAWWEMMSLIKAHSGALVVGVLFVLLNRASALVLPATIRPLIDQVFQQHELSVLPHLLFIVAIAGIIQVATSLILTELLSKAGERVVTELRIQLHTHMIALPVKFFDANRTGALVSRVMNDVAGVRNLIGSGLAEFGGAIVTFLLAFIYLCQLSIQMTLSVTGILLCYAVILRMVFVTIQPIFREHADVSADVTGRLTEAMSAVRVVKAYCAERSETQVFRGGMEKLVQNEFRSLCLQSIISLASTTVTGLGGALVMYLGWRHVEAGTLTIGGYVTYTLFLGLLISPVIGLVTIGTRVVEAIIGLERTYEILAEAQENSEARRLALMPMIEGEIRFENVSFEYDPGKAVLRDISFCAPPGSVTALVGSSGSGKSTLISLVCAFHDATSGVVYVDGRDISLVDLASYRSQLSLVWQDIFLFGGTIRENVMFSRPEATEQEFMDACRISRVDEFAERFALGYETVVGERGVKLSGGQRQRLSVARAVLSNPRILILDEATSSLDSENEAMLHQGLTELMRGRTTLVIAHRLSTIRNASQILVIEAGVIVQIGTHDDLYEAGGRYRELYDQQHYGVVEH